MKYRAISENHLYLKAYNKGKKCVAKNVIVYVLKDYASKRLRLENPQKKEINRIGLTVTKKNGNAVTRNRIKRIIREAFRQTDKQYGIKKGYLIVIVAKYCAADKKTQDIKNDILYAMNKLSMIETDNG
ncbi:MAG: ribonuclease P protein component [Ruminococcaceae bacterium]|nr:ribonuclease P protein component [Oscillospiraceae bacterium]